jgi:hypothetical protein
VVNSVSLVTFDHPFVIFVITVVVTVKLKFLPLVYIHIRAYGRRSGGALRQPGGSP